MSTKILIVEDESIVAMDLERTLKKLGYDVVGVVDTGLGAIQKIEQTRPDLVLMDIQLKGKMDGTEAAKEISNRFSIPIIFLTAYSDQATLECAKLSEPIAFLLKPIKFNLVQATIQMALNRSAAMATHQRIAKQKLEKSEESFKLFVESVKDYALYMLDTSGNIISWNSGAELIKGYRPDEIIGKNSNIFYTEEDRKAGKPERDLEIATSTGKYEGENWCLRKDGSKFWANVVITALLDDKGQIRGFGQITRDLTVMGRT